MTGLWLVGFILLWILVIILSLVTLSLAQEVVAIHKSLDTLNNYIGASSTLEKKINSIKEIKESIKEEMEEINEDSSEI